MGAPCCPDALRRTPSGRGARDLRTAEAAQRDYTPWAHRARPAPLEDRSCCTARARRGASSTISGRATMAHRQRARSRQAARGGGQFPTQALNPRRPRRPRSRWRPARVHPCPYLNSALKRPQRLARRADGASWCSTPRPHGSGTGRDHRDRGGSHRRGAGESKVWPRSGACRRPRRECTASPSATCRAHPPGLSCS